MMTEPDKPPHEVADADQREATGLGLLAELTEAVRVQLDAGKVPQTDLIDGLALMLNERFEIHDRYQKVLTRMLVCCVVSLAEVDPKTAMPVVPVPILWAFVEELRKRADAEQKRISLTPMIDQGKASGYRAAANDLAKLVMKNLTVSPGTS